MAFWISGIEAEGVRGFNRPTRIELGPGLNVLAGKNGSGKTSLLQAVEWCLAGKIDYMKGEEFIQEDAIVNIFNPARTAKVSIILQGPSSSIVVSRRRRMQKSTTRGASPLTLKANGRTFEDEEAQAQLEKLLGIPMDEISSSVYLHQESLKAILSTDPKERSRVIDKMLGIEEVHSLIESLASTRKIGIASKELQRQIERLKEEKVQFAVKMLERVGQYRTRLLNQGYSEESLTIQHEIDECAAMVEDARSIRKTLDLVSHLPEAHPTGADSKMIEQFSQAMDSALQSLDRERISAMQQVTKDKLNLANAMTQLTASIDENVGLDESSLERLASSETSMVAEGETLTSEIQKEDRASNEINIKITDFSVLQDRLASLKKQIDGLGDQETLQKTSEAANLQVKGLTAKEAELRGQRETLTRDIHAGEREVTVLNSRGTELAKWEDRLNSMKKQRESIGDPDKIRKQIQEEDSEHNSLSSREADLRGQNDKITAEIHKAEQESFAINNTITELVRQQDRMSGLNDRLDDRLKALGSIKETAEGQLREIQKTIGDESHIKESLKNPSRSLASSLALILPPGLLAALLFATMVLLEPGFQLVYTLSFAGLIFAVSYVLERAYWRSKTRAKMEAQSRMGQALDTTQALKRQIASSIEEEERVKEEFRVEMPSGQEALHSQLLTKQTALRETGDKITALKQNQEKNSIDGDAISTKMSEKKSTISQLTGLDRQITAALDEEATVKEELKEKVGIEPGTIKDKIRSTDDEMRAKKAEVEILKQNADKNSADINAILNDLDDARSAYKQSQAAIREFENMMQQERSIKEAFQKKTGIAPERIPEKIAGYKTELDKVRNSLTVMKNRSNVLAKELASVREEVQRVRTVRKHLTSAISGAQKLLHSDGQSEAVTRELASKIKQLETTEESLKQTGPLDELRARLRKVEEINEYSRMEEDLRVLEEDLPNTNALIDQLEAKVSSLSSFEASISAIREVANSYGKQTATTAISSLEDSFNGFYRSLAPHGYFTNLQLSVEKGEPPLYSIRAVSKDQSTYIPTRFSSGQMNAAAISLFLARNERMTGQLSTILLDDPTQGTKGAR